MHLIDSILFSLKEGGGEAEGGGDEEFFVCLFSGEGNQ